MYLSLFSKCYIFSCGKYSSDICSVHIIHMLDTELMIESLVAFQQYARD